MLYNINYSNVAEAMVSKGYATVIRYRQDDDQRSSHYDELLAAEMKATKSGAGVHAKKNIPNHRVADVSGVRCIIFQSAEKNFIPCFICNPFIQWKCVSSCRTWRRLSSSFRFYSELLEQKPWWNLLRVALG
jgi:hypothetical protein